MTMPRPPRRIFAWDVLAGRVDLTACPFRYVYLIAPATERRMARLEADREIDMVLASVEMLEGQGWELVNLEKLGTVAFMRRVKR